MSNLPRISIVGCGWLGLPLAKVLVKNGHVVKGTTTSREKLPILQNSGIEPYLVHFQPQSSVLNMELLNTDVLVINVPPGRRSEDGADNYRSMANYFCGRIPQSSIRKIILVSSTSVYNDTNQLINESDRHYPKTAAGQLLQDVENQFLALENKQVIILRPCGLIGPGRHPSRFFRNKTEIPNGLAPINLVHLDDVIGMIVKLIGDDSAAGVYNCCSTSHPAKQEFYSLAAKKAGGDVPDFVSEKKSWKIIESSRAQAELNYQFKYPDLLEWLKIDE